MPFDTLGWIGSICLACCAVPQAYMSWKQGHANGISAGLLWLWALGEIFTLAYISSKPNIDIPLFVNYSANIIFIGIVCWYKVYPRK